MSKGWSYKSGDWNILCDVCAQKTKASKTKERWDGFRVCPECFETRHSMDFIKARADKISVPFTRPQPTDQFVTQVFAYSNSDSFTANESIAKDVGKVVPSVPTFFGTVTTEPLGYFTLGDFVVGGSGSSGGYTNQVSLQEAVVLSYVLMPADTVTPSEVLLVIHEYNKSLGTQALGTITLG